MASYRRTYAALEAGAPSHEDEPRPAASVVSGNYLAAFRRVRDLAGAVPVADGPFSATSHAGTGYGYPLFEIPDGARGV